MLHRGSFDERFASSDIDDEEQPNGNEREKVDHSFKGPDELNPNRCPDCKKSELIATRYSKKDPVNNIRRCGNCGYLRCIRCGKSQSGRARKIDIQCSEKHCPFVIQI